MKHFDHSVLLLYRHCWQPARYAHADWLIGLGLQPEAKWQYGQSVQLDRCLDRALLRNLFRDPPQLPTQLSTRQKKWVALAPKIHLLALALGLLQIGCCDYLLLPDYRQVIGRWLNEQVIWQLFGLCTVSRRLRLSPDEVIPLAMEIGIASLHRAAVKEPVLQPLLIRLPPPKRALWVKVRPSTLFLLEGLL